MIDFDDSIGMRQEDINEIEAFTDFVLSKEVKDFLAKNSGGRYKDDKTYSLNWSTESNVELDSWIILVETKESIQNNWEHRGYLEEYMEWFELTNTNVEPKFLFPLFGLIDGAIYIAIGGLHDKQVFYADNGANGIVNVANSLDVFLNKLELEGDKLNLMK